MISKIISTPEPKTEKPFPKLMIFSDVGNEYIVLFLYQKLGTVIYSKHGSWAVGVYHEHFHMPSFTDFAGTIELSND